MPDWTWCVPVHLYVQIRKREGRGEANEEERGWICFLFQLMELHPLPIHGVGGLALAQIDGRVCIRGDYFFTVEVFVCMEGWGTYMDRKYVICPVHSLKREDLQSWHV